MFRPFALVALLAAAPALAGDAPPPAAEPASASEVEAVLAAVAREDSASERLAVIEAVAARSWFTVAQVGAVVDALAARGEKLWAFALLRGHIVDRANEAELYSHFFHEADQRAAAKLLRAVEPPAEAPAAPAEALAAR